MRADIIYKLYVRLFAVGLLVAMVVAAVAGWLEELDRYNEGRGECFSHNISYAYCDDLWAANYPNWIDLASGPLTVMIYAVPAFVAGIAVLRLLRWAIDPLVAIR